MPRASDIGGSSAYAIGNGNHTVRANLYYVGGHQTFTTTCHKCGHYPYAFKGEVYCAWCGQK